MVWILNTAITNQIVDSAGAPLDGGSLEFYLAGTSTPTPVASDKEGISKALSYTLDTEGRPQTTGGTAVSLYFDSSVSYKIVLKDSAGVIIPPINEPFDPIPGTSQGLAEATTLDGQPGSFYTDLANATGVLPASQVEDSGTLDGQPGSFYTDLANATGVLPASQVEGGTGSGLDAAFLDGNNGAFYQDLSNAIGELPASQVQNGPGSGLNADLLDGFDSPYYLNLFNSTGSININQVGNLSQSLQSKPDFFTNAGSSSILGGSYYFQIGRFLINVGSVDVPLDSTGEPFIFAQPFTAVLGFTTGLGSGSPDFTNNIIESSITNTGASIRGGQSSGPPSTKVYYAFYGYRGS